MRQIFFRVHTKSGIVSSFRNSLSRDLEVYKVSFFGKFYHTRSFQAELGSTNNLQGVGKRWEIVHVKKQGF